MTVAQITARKDTSANWATANPILAAGELGFDTTVKRLKMGDGLTSWGSLGWATMATDEVAAVLAASESINAGIDTTDGAFATVLANPESESSTELNAAFVRFVDQNGAPLPAGSLTTIHVNTTTGDIDDITFEGV
jgi:Major tropism determinant N-terminal domain